MRIAVSLKAVLLPLAAPAALAFLFTAAPLRAQQQQYDNSNPPMMKFKSVPGFPTLPPGQNLGEVPGVAVNSKGHVFVFTRENSANGPAYGAAAAQLLEFTADGQYVREIGKGLYAWAEAHSVRIDKDDNIWAVDKGSDMIVRFNPQGRVVWVFGRKHEAADDPKPEAHVNPPLPPQDGDFRQPTDVAWDSQGNIYITDGYVNSRVAKFSKDGDWIMSFGEPGTGPGQFRTPHQIAIDKNDNVYVGDRSNHRVQIFNTDGKFQRMWEIDTPPDMTSRAVNGATPKEGSQQLKNGIGAPNSLCIVNSPSQPSGQVLFLGESTFPGRVFKVTLDGKVLGVIGRSGRLLGEFSGVHQIACPTENLIYAAETSNWRVQKLILAPEKDPPASAQKSTLSPVFAWIAPLFQKEYDRWATQSAW